MSFPANLPTCQHFPALIPLLPHLCPMSVPYGGGGYMGYIRKALEKAYLEHPGSACCTDDMLEIFVHFGWCLCCLLPVFVNSQLPCLHTNFLPGLLFPPMHHKSLWCVKGLALGVQSGCR